ncbi:MAG TPA: hypothetical protein VGR13_08375 [Actinomycetota bacterium]|jgi:hypothetical protein|nr:hypothetical protein [Actinomycetota bacterium]
MPDQTAIDSIANSFQQWASGLPSSDQEVLGQWMTRWQGADVEGHSGTWWTGNDAWSSAWKDSWNW